MVEAEDETVHHPLLILGAEPRVHFFADVRDAVAVGVLEVPDVRGRGDEHAALPRLDAAGPEQAVRENRARIETPVAIGVAQQPDRATRLAVRLGPLVLPRDLHRLIAVVGIIAHLGDVEIAALVEGRDDRIAYQRLGGDQFHVKPGRRFEQLEGRGRRGDRHWFEERLQFRLGGIRDAAVGREVADAWRGHRELGRQLGRIGVSRESALLPDLEQHVARALEISQDLRSVGELPLRVHRELLVDARDPRIERDPLIRRAVVEVNENGIGVRLGIGLLDRGIRVRPRRDPGGLGDWNVALDFDPPALALSPGDGPVLDRAAVDDQVDVGDGRDFTTDAQPRLDRVRTIAGFADLAARFLAIDLK